MLNGYKLLQATTIARVRWLQVAKLKHKHAVANNIRIGTVLCLNRFAREVFSP